MANTEYAVRARGLTKVYGEGDTAVRALHNIDFELPKGEFVVLLGASGSGKTTLLNQIGALEPPTEGSIESNGLQLNQLDEEGRTDYRLNTVGFIFQFYNLVPTLTARENVELIADITGEDPAERAQQALMDVGLADRMEHFPGQLSGGQQQRVSIARGLVKSPPLLLCDEPTGALDVESSVEILTLLRQVTESDERSVIVVTHNTEIPRIANRVLHLRDGQIVGEDVEAEPPVPTDINW